MPFDLPWLLLGDQKQQKILFYHGECLWRGTKILVNSVFELEFNIIKGLQDMHPNNYKGNHMSELHYHYRRFISSRRWT